MMSLEFCGTSDDVFLVSSNCFISCIVTSGSLILSLCICNSFKCTTVVCSELTSIITE